MNEEQANKALSNEARKKIIQELKSKHTGKSILAKLIKYFMYIAFICAIGLLFKVYLYPSYNKDVLKNNKKKQETRELISDDISDNKYRIN